MKKEYKKAHEQSVLVVGEYYLVAHVNVKNQVAINPFDVDIPVIPIWHNDKKVFNVAADHYHIDGRFLTDKSKPGKIWRVMHGYTASIITTDHGNIVSEVFFKKKKCLRLQTGVPGVRFHAPEFEKKYVGKSCKGRRCPHWGAVMNEINGILVCPMHGLKGDIEKERIIID